MNRISFVRAVLTVAILAGTSTIRADEPAKTDPKDVEISALREKVTAQSDEIHKLRAELKELKAKQQMKALVVPQPPNAPQTVPAPGAMKDNAGRIPPTWIPREFNGMTYYLIPLGEDAARAKTIVAPATPQQNSAPAEAPERYAPKP